MQNRKKNCVVVRVINYCVLRVFVVVIEIRKYLKVEMYFCYQEIGTKPINGIGYDNVY